MTRRSGERRRDGDNDGVGQESGVTEFERLLAPLMDGLYRFACRLERDPDRARDLLQESLLKAWHGFQGIRAHSSFRQWLGRIIYRGFLDGVRDRTREVQIDETIEVMGATNQADTPSSAVPADLDRVLADRMVSREIAAAVDRLPLEQAVAVYLVDVEGHQFSAAAEILGVTPGTVASRVSRGRSALRVSLWRLARERGWIKT
jgi:RNA polymerase sigma-70 factor (ECF subfamily)